MTSHLNVFQKLLNLAWIGMFIAIFVVSLGSLSGIIAAPISKKKWFPYLIMCLISLAVATLIGDAILHLFPHVSPSLAVFMNYETLTASVARVEH